MLNGYAKCSGTADTDSYNIQQESFPQEQGENLVKVLGDDRLRRNGVEVCGYVTFPCERGLSAMECSLCVRARPPMFPLC